jgi:hypothetical protein
MTSHPNQIVFLLSPAHCGGRRARMLMNPEAEFPLARRLREAGLPLGEAFSFLSGLYFRGKLAYASAFARRSAGTGVLVITPGRGLLDAAHSIRLEDLLAMAEVPVSLDEPRYRVALERDARRLAESLEPDDVAVLLGSIASDKYVEILDRVLGSRLRFPSEFVGRGDMSRGGLMLRCANDGRELTYVPLEGAIRRGPRPPRLEPLAAVRARARAVTLPVRRA